MADHTAIACALYLLNGDPVRAAEYFNGPSVFASAPNKKRPAGGEDLERIQPITFSANKTPLNLEEDLMMREEDLSDERAKWKVLDFSLGEGSFGTVLDVQSNLPGAKSSRQYAIKIQRRKKMSENKKYKFVTEVFAQTKAAELDIAPHIYDWGYWTDGVGVIFFIIMEKGGPSMLHPIDAFLSDTKPDTNVYMTETKKKYSILKPTGVFDLIFPKAFLLQTQRYFEQSNNSGLYFDPKRFYYWCCELLDKLVRLHCNGIFQEDLFRRNMITGPNGEIWIIDYGEAELYPPAVPYGEFPTQAYIASHVSNGFATIIASDLEEMIRSRNNTGIDPIEFDEIFDFLKIEIGLMIAKYYQERT